MSTPAPPPERVPSHVHPVPGNPRGLLRCVRCHDPIASGYAWRLALVAESLCRACNGPGASRSLPTP